jgi:hypothetical protein
MQKNCFDWDCSCINGKIVRGSHYFDIHTGKIDSLDAFTAALLKIQQNQYTYLHHSGAYWFHGVYGHFTCFSETEVISRSREFKNRTDLKYVDWTIFSPEAHIYHGALKLILPQPIYEEIWQALMPRTADEMADGATSQVAVAVEIFLYKLN